MRLKNDEIVKTLKRRISVIPANPGSGPGQAPESRYFKYLKILWTPVFGELSRAVSTGVTTFYEVIKNFCRRISRFSIQAGLLNRFDDLAISRTTT